MKNKLTQIMLYLIAVVVLSSFASKLASNKSYHLFKIERSKDANEIFYDVNLDSKKNIDISNPLNIYWIKHTANGKIEPLTWIQQKYAYGVEYLSKSKNTAEFQFVSYNKRQFQIKTDSKGDFKVFTKSKNKLVIVNRIFIQIDGGTFWFPTISRVELHTQDIQTNEKSIEIINP